MVDKVTLKQQSIYLGCPTHNGQIEHRVITSLFSTASQQHQVFVKVRQTSLLAAGCNHMYCDALNKRSEYGFTWFAMLHSDIAPEPFWLDTMIALAEHHDADLLSAVVPIKSDEGVTSTAISHPESPFLRFARLTQRQVNRPDWPKTFNIKQALAHFSKDTPHYPKPLADSILLVNTGCMLVRLDRVWSEHLFFTINDRVMKVDGKFMEQVEPEDWFFSRLVNDYGGNVMATTEIQLEHIGSTPYPSRGAWGAEIDPAINRV